jgi:hypothetical protein
MTHPRELIARAQSEELGAAERALVQSHLDSCYECRRLDEELAADERRLGLPEPPASLRRAQLTVSGRSAGVFFAALLMAAVIGLAGGLGIGTLRAGAGQTQPLPLASPSATLRPTASIIPGTAEPGRFAGLLYNEPIRSADGWHFTGTVSGGPAPLYDVRIEIEFPDGSQIGTLVASTLSAGEVVTFDLVTQRPDIKDWSPRVRWTIRK